MESPSSTAASSSEPASSWAARFRRPLPRAFYDRPVLTVARGLVGQYLVRRDAGHWQVGRIVETEAYGAGDPASHAFRGITTRNRSMFVGPGTLYVYRIHQVHCANAVTRRGEAVLLRAAEPVAGSWADPRGPGRLCRALGLERKADATDLVRGPLRIVAAAVRPHVERSPRVGIRLAADRLWRFSKVGSPWVSRPRPASGRRST